MGVWGLSSHWRIFHSYGDVIITGEGLQILTYTPHSWPKTSNGSLACHSYCDLGLSRLRFEYREVNTITDCATAAAISTVVEFISIVAKLSVCVQNHLCLINVKVPYTRLQRINTSNVCIGSCITSMSISWCIFGESCTEDFRFAARDIPCSLWPWSRLAWSRTSLGWSSHLLVLSWVRLISLLKEFIDFDM